MEYDIRKLFPIGCHHQNTEILKYFIILGGYLSFILDFFILNQKTVEVRMDN